VKRPLLIIANPQANACRAPRDFDGILNYLRGRHHAFDFQITDNAGHTTRLTAHRAHHYHTIAAAGGDGTTNAVAHGLLSAAPDDVALAVLPIGTGNDAARAIGLLSLDTALDTLCNGTVRRIDAIEVTCQLNGRAVTRFSLVYAAAGFATEILKQTTPTVKRLAGPRWAYSVGLLRALARLRCPTMRVRTDTMELDGALLLAAAGNAEAAGGGLMRLFPGAVIDDGLLNVTLIDRLSWFQILRRLPHLYRGTHVHLPHVHTATATTVDVATRSTIDVQVDGEICGGTPAKFTLRPGALRVVAPHRL
jgi:diacylglycerol kinase (ATP)